MTIYVYGIDLAESLNYWCVWINAVNFNRVRIATIRAGKDGLYPDLEHMIKTELIPRFPPREIWIDYTSEKSFSEWLESDLHPAFKNPSSSQYKKWKYVEPVIFSQPVKLNMKQNARQMMEPDEKGHQIFEWPDIAKCHPTMAKFVTEAKAQHLREAGITSPMSGGTIRMRFPKPQGYDNDFVMANELSLMGCRKFVTHFSGTGGVPIVHGAKLKDPKEKVDPLKVLTKKTKERMGSFNVTSVSYDIPS